MVEDNKYQIKRTKHQITMVVKDQVLVDL